MPPLVIANHAFVIERPTVSSCIECQLVLHSHHRTGKRSDGRGADPRTTIGVHTMSNEDENDEGKTLKWGKHERLPGDLPAITLLRLAQEGFTHYLGNRVSSKITAWRKTDEGKGADDAGIEAKAEEFRSEFLAAMDEGKLGSRVASAGPRATGFDAILRAVCVEWLKAKLGASGVKMPTGDKTVSVRGKDYTREQLVEQTVERADKVEYAKGVSLRAEAERREAADKGIEGTVDELFS